jgi:hypothetical protein
MKACLEAASRLVDEGRLSFEQDGLRIREMDQSQIALVDVLVPRKTFTTYPEVTEPVGYGISIKMLKQFVAKAVGNLRLCFRDGRLNLNYEKKVFTMPLLESTGSPHKVPVVAGASEFQEDTGTFFGWVKDVQIVSSHVSFESKEGKILVVGNSETGNASIETKFVGDKILATFPIDFLAKLNLGGMTRISIFLKSNAPIRIQYCPGPALGSMEINYWLAPRIEPG